VSDTEKLRVASIRELNDQLRQCGIGGQIMITSGIQARGPLFRQKSIAGGSGLCRL